MTAGRGRTSRATILFVWVLIPAALLVFVAANAHLVYVAYDSRPGCVPHLKEAGKDGNFRAAKSAC